MWQRFELFWTAFEKFALFFSFLGTLTGLIFVALIYRGVTEPSPAALVCTHTNACPRAHAAHRCNHRCRAPRL